MHRHRRHSNRCVPLLLSLLCEHFGIHFRSVIYCRKYSKSPRYDNFYESRELRRLDNRRLVLGMTTILPFRRRERQSYVSILSLRMIAIEKKKLTTSFGLFLVTVCSIGYFMALDYGIHWFSTMLNSYGRFVVNIQGRQTVCILQPYILYASDSCP